MELWHFSYSNKYYITHPWIWFGDLFRGLKYMAQRAFRGWDDTVVWSIDFYLAQNMPVWLRVLRDNKHGIPMACFDEADIQEDGSISEGGMEKAEQRWEDALNRMIIGFEAAYRIASWEHDENGKLQSDFDEGMKLFHEYFFSLWD